MCEATTKLIFCRCEDQVRGKEIFWVLERKGLKIERPGRWVGAMMIPQKVNVEEYSPEDILEILNYESPFDFPYQPKQGDTFMFCFEGVWSLSYNYTYSRGQWKRASDLDYDYEMLTIAEGTLHIIDLRESKQPTFKVRRY